MVAKSSIELTSRQELGLGKRKTDEFETLKLENEQRTGSTSYESRPPSRAGTIINCPSARPFEILWNPTRGNPMASFENPTFYTKRTEKLNNITYS